MAVGGSVERRSVDTRGSATITDQPESEIDVASSRRARILSTANAHDVPLLTILVTVGVVAAVFLTGKLLYRLRDVVLLMLVGGFLALVLNPLVTSLQRHRVARRGVAVTLVTLWSLLVFVGLAVAFGYPLVRSITHLANTLPSYVDKAQHGKGWIGHLLRRYHVENWIHRNSSKLISLAQGLSKPALALGKGAASALLAFITTFAFVILLLLEAPKMRTALLGFIPEARTDRLLRISSEISRSAAGYVLGNLLTSLIAGVVVFITLSLLSVPFAFLWGLWVALVDFLPTIGGALAGIPTVLFALGHSLTAGIVTLVVFVIYTQVENHFLNPVVMSRTTKLNPLTVFMAVIIGAEVGSWVGGLFGGFVCILLAVPAAAMIQVVVRETWHSTRTAPVTVDGGPSDHLVT